jgi:hypothetical protein
MKKPRVSNMGSRIEIVEEAKTHMNVWQRSLVHGPVLCSAQRLTITTQPVKKPLLKI